MKSKLYAPVLALVVAGCAKGPDAISPMAMPVNAYSGLSCEQLIAEHQRSSAALAAVSSQQKQAVAGDAVGVFLVGVPMSSLTGGDKEGYVAQHKGEVIAIEVALRNAQCGYTPPPPPPAPKVAGQKTGTR